MKIKIHPFSLALGALLVAVVGTLLAWQVPVSPTALQRVRVLGPVEVVAPQIVNLESINYDEGDAMGYLLCPGGNTPIFQVPPDRSLVVTNWEADVDSFLSLAEETMSGTEIRLSGCTAVPAGSCFSPNVSSAHFDYPMGLRFAPGSRVVIFNATGVADKKAAFRLSGYLKE